jgi:predicted solute-binding protein
LNLKHEQEWDAVLAKYQGKVAQTKDSTKISSYLDTYVNNYAEIRKQMEEQWKAQDEHALLRLQKKRKIKSDKLKAKLGKKKRISIGHS